MITADFSEAFNALKKITEALQSISEKNEVLREVAVNMLPVVRDRIHGQGLDATGSLIGNYTKEYMKVRTGQFLSNGTYLTGKRKGQTRVTGVFTKGKDKGAPRPQYNRDADTKVIISLTRQMENDFSVQASGGLIGLGYNNIRNSEKAEFVEHTYQKKIFALTPQEKDQAIDIANDAVNNILKKHNAA
jgi:hypothetical protein